MSRVCVVVRYVVVDRKGRLKDVCSGGGGKGLDVSSLDTGDVLTLPA